MNSLNNKITHMPINSGLMKFIAIFVALAWLFNALYSNYFLEWKVFNPYVNFCVGLCKYILELTGEKIELVYLTNGILGEIHTMDGAYVRFTEGADGVQFIAIMAAAIIAWPGNWLKKLLAVVLSAAFLFALNIARVCILLKIDVYFGRQFDLMNEWIMPGLMTLAAVGCFLIWARISGRHPYDETTS